MSFVMPGAPVDKQDVVDAARIVLRLLQDNTYIAWRENRWYSDEDLAKQVEEQRWRWLMDQHRYTYIRDSKFSLPLAQDILISGISYTPMAAISSLDQLGLNNETSTDADFEDALCLLDYPGLFDGIRESKFPLSEVRVCTKILGKERLRLMFRAGLSNEEILADTYSGTLADESMLRMLAGLLAPTEPT